MPALLTDGAEIEAGRSVLALRPSVPPAPIEASSTGAGEIGVNRPPRMVPASLEVSVEAPAVPTRPRGQRLPLVAALVPLLGGVVMWQLMHSTNYLIVTLLAPLMAMGTYAQDRMGGRGDFRKAMAQLSVDQDEVTAAVDAQLTTEYATRRDRYPDAAEVVRRVIDTDHRLWERRPEHLDHLALRVGLADLPSELHMTYGQRDGDKDVRAEMERALPERRELVNVPAVVALAEVGVVGVVGPAAERAALTRWLTVQLAALHSPRDVEIAAVLGPDDAADWEWLKWLPHVRDSSLAHAGAPPVATTTLQVSTLVDAIGAMQRDRLEAQKTLVGQQADLGPDLVLLVEGAGVHDRAAMSEVLGRWRTTDVHVLWEAEDARQLPDGCRVIIEVDGERSIARITDTATREVIDEVTLDGLTLDLTEAVATSLAPLRDVTQADRGLGSLPAIAHLADLERFSNPTADAVLERWADLDGPATFTLGGGPQGPLRLDLVEHGPHALVGGTPGAGKSELLRGVLASLALRYPPSRITFLLVDFKGGAAFREFAAIPHTVGIVTDLDEHLAERALTSFRAEIKYREGVLDELGAIDVLDLERRAPHARLPRLVIVIDEFATLAQEVPAFVDGVIDVTQRGRSLGVHLVLATQSPRGSVTGKIRANTNLAIGLRTVSADESNDILGTPDAAAIPVQRKGRAWARIGDRDLVPFQSGYVGGSTFGYRELETRVAPFRL
ncbi:MAG: FtsK/SpoIIIE domain-containing protein, partial [Solirubrobacteraceae bacterium]